MIIGLAPWSARAQERVVAGVLVDARTQHPVAGAQVRTSEGERRAVSDAAGRFRLADVPGTTVTLVVVAIGYRPFRAVVGVGSSDVRLELSEAAVALDELIVTGTVGEVERRAIGNSVTKVDVARQLALAPVPDLTSLINGRAPGVVVIPGSGQVGAGPTIRIRGARSFSLNTNPLVYVDGVRVDNEVASGNTRVQAGSGVINRLNDFNPEEIESIEIIKGPAAATLYGTEASNGVIQIITRQGRAGIQPEFTVTVRQGATWFMNPEGRITPNWGVDPATGDTISLDLFASERALGREIFRTGRVEGYAISVRGGAETVRYSASADLDRDDGIEPTNYLRRLGARASLGITPSEKVDVTASLGFTRGHTQLACEGPCGFGVWPSLIFGDPALRDTPRRGFLFAPPEVLWGLFDTFQDLDRTQFGLSLKHQPTGWFSQRLTVGGDRTHEDNQEILRRDDALTAFFPPAIADGQKSVNRRDVTMTTVDYSATLSVPLPRWTGGVTSATSVGTQYYHKLTRLVGASIGQFPVSGLETVSPLGATTGSDAFIENNTLGFFVQQQLDYRDRLFLTAALRADDNSAFGKDFDVVYYPKVSAAWVLYEEPWWRVPHVDALRVRAAFGASGQQPDDFAALRSYAPITSGSAAPAITPQFIGNDSLAPERGEELEVGFEAAFLNHRIGVDFTYYAARTKDAILLRDLAPSLGFPGGQFVNAGEIRNRGVELQVRARPYQARNVAVDLSLNLATNSNEVVDLGGIDQGKGFVQVPGAFARQRHVPGFPAGAWFTRIVVSADIDPVLGVAGNLLCDGGTGPRLTTGEPTLPGGSPVPCDTAPYLFVGRPFPKLEGSVEARVTLFGRLQLYGLVDFKSGHKKLDNTAGLRCGVAEVCRENFFPREYDPRIIAEMQQNGTIDNWIIHGASFAKLRELSANYALPDAWTRRIGARRAVVSVAGRNLHTWTGYAWLDPESEFVEGPGAVGGEREPYNRQQAAHSPQRAQFITTIRLTF
ncbi:MAG: TonB-dependent receptor domain-containing protein [Gemmatimonadales bacterium]